ncbi:MAG: hypothetical protein A2750_01905 [Candidatus Yanofskybacteria bacterium RIFCSPHIGHO2_01_FULL_45_42]|uniref:dolichyl-phosphate beta-glucosyltransferase n=3 Tax=Candidatus Yanofskyibacteriota TaxID=1752733 RepID=A0A1F8H4M9_9BACT|nr:MAG: hypothetical protein A2750_01905 [Candidatus Yanofskybacteria bacterium RIFCSPHIGHO2_01_FULL_45_42]OGN15593.1 MAG: hypothetical protein A3C81_00290 [Candidatus Yanofskybacteria bacterium RIFCSPHIGHO2_02_FULL_46_19]OGN27268.1 MAG: hypothetical protein A3B17_00700 [Candidatus Yanofskybacteria bacterium RIFCSPLOWO2_01_FULL_45_72]OGN32230.1 MAG: hypothetical protein A3J01_01280 [Candidatus Yanofskybacteria bacterium RIFCSPLOWO2_02_FULL_45_18]
MRLSVIIPAYNEEKRILSTLGSVSLYLQKQPYDYEIIVVNDGSSDRTASVVESLKSKVQSLRIIDKEKNQGKARAVQAGILAAQGVLRLFMDADNSTKIENLDKMIPYINEGYDVVIASIGTSGAKVAGAEPFYKRLLGKLGNLWIRLCVLPGVKDTQRGFKLFTAQAVEKIFPEMRTSGWGFDVELLALARRFSYKIKEVPIEWRNPPGSKVSLWSYPKVFFQVLKIRWNLRTGKYGNYISN